jgi:hypothetical protein
MSIIPFWIDALHDVVLAVMLACISVNCNDAVDRLENPVSMPAIETIVDSILTCNACTAALAASIADASTWTVIC